MKTLEEIGFSTPTPIQDQAIPHVLEGRDIGTVVFPNAPIKIWMDAALETRAGRRSQKEGRIVTPEELAERDAADYDREDCPMRQPDDAIVLDSTFTTVDELIEFGAAVVFEQRLPAPQHHDAVHVAIVGVDLRGQDRKSVV